MACPSFIFKRDKYLSKVQKEGTEVRLLAKADNVEVHRQLISAQRTFWMDSAEEWQGFEFIYLLQGHLACLDTRPPVVLEPGDYIARHLVQERSYFEAQTDVVLLYISSQPAYRQVSQETKEFVRLAKQIEQDEYTDGHCNRISHLARLLGEWMDLPGERLFNLGYAAFFHDLGKAKVPKEILQKSSELSPEEWKVMRQHTVWGRQMLESKEFFKEVAPIVEQTHERVDGRGYPRGLQGDEISLEAKIISVVDTYDAMTTDRSYRRALPVEEAIRRLRAGAGTQFDPQVVEACVEMLKEQEVQPSFDPEWLKLKRWEAILLLGEEILADKHIQQILDQVVQAIVEYTPFRRAALALYDRAIPPHSIEQVRISRIACAGLSPVEAEHLSTHPLPPSERRKIFDERFQMGRSYYIPHDQLPWADHSGLIPSHEDPGPRDTWHPDDFLCIPMWIRNRVVGIISVDEPADGQRPTPQSLEPSEVFANFAALAIERARHLKQLRETLREREWFNSFLQGLNHVHRLEELLLLIIRRGIELLSPRADAGSFLLWDEARGAFEFKAAVNRPLAALKRIPLSPQHHLQAVLSAEQPVILSRAQQRANPDLRQLLQRGNVRPPASTIVVPIREDGRLTALLNVNSLETEGAFGPSDAQKLGALVPEIELALARARDRERLKLLAVRDPLTGAYNRHYLNQLVEAEGARARRHDFPISLILLDFVDFYQVNDRFGHLEGDRVLRQATAVFQQHVRACDSVIRYGGDEFLVVLPQTDRQEAQRACDRLERAIQSCSWGLPLPLSIRTGVSVWSPTSRQSFEAVLEEADAWMYRHRRLPKQTSA